MTSFHHSTFVTAFLRMVEHKLSYLLTYLPPLPVLTLVPGDGVRSRPKTSKMFQLPYQRAKTVNFEGGSELAGRSPGSEIDRRRHSEHLRGTRMYGDGGGQDSDRSLASSKGQFHADLGSKDRSLASTVSLGEKIVAKSRENQRPASGKTRTKSTRKNVEQHNRDLSPSGLVLEGCRVQLRPSSSVSSHDARPSSAAARRTANNTRGPAGTSGTGGPGSRITQNGRPRTASAGTRQNGWTDDVTSSLCGVTSSLNGVTSSLNDVLYAECQTRSAAGCDQVYSSFTLSNVVNK